MQFKDLHLDESLLRAVSEEGYETPTPIQEAAIPMALAGEDLLATAQTGTGKTAAFSLPILQNLEVPKGKGLRPIRALVLAPTRELALQIEASFRTYGRHKPFRTAVILGGVSAVPQISALRKGADIVVATPGRLIDLYRQGHVRLDRVETLVLDEADRMLDMGFAPDVRKIVAKLPRERQTMMFSATLSADIAKLSSDMLRDPSMVAVTPAASVSTNITQQVMFVEQMDKRRLLSEILTEKSTLRALVFTRTKHRANRVVRQLLGEGIKADAIHSNKSQAARQRALSAFHGGSIKVLVATDIAARGIDVEGISHVINYEMPNDPESYVHRIGRTARAGTAGMAMSFCNADEIPLLGGIERLTRSPLVAVDDHPFHSDAIASLHEKRTPARSGVTPVKPARPRFGRKKVVEGPSTRRGRR
jgi:ATP-dependent RNA helicase RhlE